MSLPESYMGGSGAGEESLLQPNTLLPTGMGTATPSLPINTSQPVQPTPDPWQTVARMLRGFQAGTAGQPNPVIQLEQQQQRLEQQSRLMEFNQRLQMEQMVLQERARKVQEAQLDLAVKKEARIEHTALEESALKAETAKLNLLGTMAKLPSVDARVLAGQGYADAMKKYGMEAPPGFAESFRAAPIDKKDLEPVATLLLAGMPPDQVAQMQGVAVPVVTALHKALQAGDPNVSRLLTGKTPNELKLDALKVTEEEQKIVLNDMKIDDPGVSQAARDAAIGQFGKRFIDLDPGQRKQAVEIGYQRELAKAKATAGLQPVPLETTFQISDWERLGGNIAGAQKILASGAADKFIGPMLSGTAAARRAAVKNLPEEWVGKVPDELTALSMAERSLQNVRMRAVSGAAVTENELTRNLGELPNMETDKPEVYRFKFRHWAMAAQVIERRLKAFSGIEGRTNLSVEMKSQLKAQAVRENPLPSPTSEGISDDLAAQGWRKR